MRSAVHIPPLTRPRGAESPGLHQWNSRPRYLRCCRAAQWRAPASPRRYGTCRLIANRWPSAARSGHRSSEFAPAPDRRSPALHPTKRAQSGYLHAAWYRSDGVYATSRRGPLDSEYAPRHARDPAVRRSFLTGTYHAQTVWLQ